MSNKRSNLWFKSNKTNSEFCSFISCHDRCKQPPTMRLISSHFIIIQTTNRSAILQSSSSSLTSHYNDSVKCAESRFLCPEEQAFSYKTMFLICPEQRSHCHFLWYTISEEKAKETLRSSLPASLSTSRPRKAIKAQIVLIHTIKQEQ